jgi:Fur family ferric uptake transcriptional regulator
MQFAGIYKVSRSGYDSVVNRDETIKAILQNAGLRRTPVRLAVLDAVISSIRPLGAPDVIRQLGEDTDSVTVYRTLNTLAEHKLVHRVRGEGGAWQYAASSANESEQKRHPHAHFVCDECGTVECLQRMPVPGALAHPTGLGKKYDVTYAEVLVHGVCPNCH